MLFLETTFHINVCRALIGQPNPAEELAMLEAKAAQTWGKIYSDIFDIFIFNIFDMIFVFCCQKFILIVCHHVNKNT